MFQSLRISGLLPATLPESASLHSEVWNAEAEVKKGEHVLVSAASGRGKSTFISILYGLRTDFQGKYLYNGEDSRLISPAQWSLLRSSEISIVFQDLRLFPDYTVRENLEIKGQLAGSNYNPEEASSMCRLLGIGDFMDRKCGTLSFGERQRVAIVRALIQKAELILMDEPFSHLDRDNSEVALDLILKKASENGSSLLITSLGGDYGWKYHRILSL